MLARVGRVSKERLKAWIPAASIIGCIIRAPAGLELTMDVPHALLKFLLRNSLESIGNRSNPVAGDQAYVIVVRTQQRLAADDGQPFRARGRSRTFTLPSKEPLKEGKRRGRRHHVQRPIGISPIKSRVNICPGLVGLAPIRRIDLYRLEILRNVVGL